jgi:hypothetical protein
MRVQTHTDGYNVSANVDYALTIDQTLRFGTRMPMAGATTWRQT